MSFKNVSSIIFLSYCLLHYPAIKDVLSFEGKAEINDPNQNDEFTVLDEADFWNKPANRGKKY